MMARFFKRLFFILAVYPVTRVFLGIRIKNAHNIPENGPAILIANHNSHLDTVVMMSLFGLKDLPKVKAVAAADYFLKTKLMSWFSKNCIGIIPLARKRQDRPTEGNPLEGIFEALRENSMVIFFPEGSRGLPEEMTDFRLGIAKVAKEFPSVPIIPFFMHGLGKALPKGEGILVPFFCDVVVGEPTYINANEEGADFVSRLRKTIADLSTDIHLPKVAP